MRPFHAPHIPVSHLQHTPRCNKIFALSYPDPRNGILCLPPLSRHTPQAIPIERPLPFWEPALAAVFGLVFGRRHGGEKEIGKRGGGKAWTGCSCRRRFFCLLLGNFVCTFSQLPHDQQHKPCPLPAALVPSPSAALFTLSQLPLSLHCKLHSQLAFMFAFYASDYPVLPSLPPLSLSQLQLQSPL